MFECVKVQSALNTYHFTSVYSGWQCADVLLSSRYDLVKDNMNWYLAHMHCQSTYRAKLVMIANRADQLRLQAYLETFEGQLLRCLVLCSHIGLNPTATGFSIASRRPNLLGPTRFRRRLGSKPFIQFTKSSLQSSFDKFLKYHCQIWHDDALWPSPPCRPLFFRLSRVIALIIGFLLQSRSFYESNSNTKRCPFTLLWPLVNTTTCTMIHLSDLCPANEGLKYRGQTLNSGYITVCFNKN